MRNQNVDVSVRFNIVSIILILIFTGLGRSTGVARKAATRHPRPSRVEIANLFAEASKSYHENPTALHLRAMIILYEGLNEKGALMLVPSTAVESMGLGGMLGAAAMRQDKLSAGEGS